MFVLFKYLCFYYILRFDKKVAFKLYSFFILSLTQDINIFNEYGYETISSSTWAVKVENLMIFL